QGHGSSRGPGCAAATGWADAGAAARAAVVPVMVPARKASPAAAARTDILARPGRPAPGRAAVPSRRLPPAAMRAASIAVSSFIDRTPPDTAGAPETALKRYGNPTSRCGAGSGRYRGWPRAGYPKGPLP